MLPSRFSSMQTFKITLGAQLGSGANAADWQVAMFQHVGGFSDTVAGDLSGGEAQHRNTAFPKENVICISTYFFPALQILK